MGQPEYADNNLPSISYRAKGKKHNLGFLNFAAPPLEWFFFACNT